MLSGEELVTNDDVVSYETRLPKIHMPGRCGHTAVTVGRSILVWGGYSENHTFNRYYEGEDIWLYDVEANIWDGKAVTNGSPPRGCSGSVALLLHNSLYIFGGHDQFGPRNSIHKLDLTKLIWNTCSPSELLPSPRDKFVGWTANKRLYYFGGFSLPLVGYLADHGVFTFDVEVPQGRGWNNQLLEFNPETQTWRNPKALGSIPLPRAAHCTTQVDGCVYVYGGRHQRTRLGDMYKLEQTAESHVWSSVDYTNTGPEGRSWASIVSIDDQHLCLYGGFSNTEQPFGDAWSFNLMDKHWTELQLSSKMLNNPRLWHTASVVTPGEMIIIGGCSSNLLQVQAEQPNTVSIFRTSPPTLQAFALRSTVLNRHLTEDSWCYLPTELRETIGRILSDGNAPEHSEAMVEEAISDESDDDEQQHNNNCSIS